MSVVLSLSCKELRSNLRCLSKQQQDQAFVCQAELERDELGGDRRGLEEGRSHSQVSVGWELARHRSDAGEFPSGKQD